MILNIEKISSVEITEKEKISLFTLLLTMPISGDLNKLRAGVVTITKEMAIIMLKSTSFSNRRAKLVAIKNYKKSFQNKDWSLTGETIKFDDKYNLVDGFNRLLAFIQSGEESFETLVVQGIKRDAIFNMDSGTNRSMEDVITMSANNSDDVEMRGVLNKPVISATIKLLTCFNKGIYSDIGSAKRVLSKRETAVIFNDDYKRLNAAGAFGVSAAKKCKDKLLTPTMFSTLFYIMNEISPNEAQTFLSQLATGVDLKEGSPIVALRRRLMTNKFSKQQDFTQKEVVLLIITAWNKFRKNEEISFLVCSKDAETVGFK